METANQEFGIGKHVWDVPIAKLAGGRLVRCPALAKSYRQRLNQLMCAAFQVTWGTEWCYVLASSGVRISVLLFYRRLSVSFTKTFRVATWIGIIYNACYAISFLLVIVLICSPTEAYWKELDPTWLKAGHTFKCGNEGISLPASGVLSVFGDFYSTALPLILVTTLTIPFRQKLSLYALFALGFV